MDIVQCQVCHNFFNKLSLPQHISVDHSSVFIVKKDKIAPKVKKKQKYSSNLRENSATEFKKIKIGCEGMILKRYMTEYSELETVQHCAMCDTRFPTTDFEQHTLTKHGVVTVYVYKCSLCSMEFENSISLLTHKANHGTGMPSEVEFSASEDNRPVAQDMSNQSENMILCEECLMTFTERSELVVHRFIEHGARGGERPSNGLIQCHDCDDVFTERKTLYWHRQEKHLYRCQDCNDSFSTQAQLTKHISDLGPHQCQFDCTDCGASFDSKIRLKLHRDRHLQKYQCDICKKNLSSIHSLNTHKKSKHSGDIKPYKCKICKKAFPYPTSLRYHMRTHGEKLIICQFCGLKFHFAFNYKRHVELNHGRPEDKVVCEHCGGLYSKVKLRDHLARHGEATLPCNLCGKKFRLKEQLKRHKVQLHKEKRPHSCPVCGKGFVKPENLVNHYTKKHREANPNLDFKPQFFGAT